MIVGVFVQTPKQTVWFILDKFIGTLIVLASAIVLAFLVLAFEIYISKRNVKIEIKILSVVLNKQP